jgi:hypothetical protein
MLSTSRKRPREGDESDNSSDDFYEGSEELLEPEETGRDRKRARLSQNFEKYHNIFTARTPLRSLRVQLENAISDLIHKDYTATGGMLSRPEILGASSLPYNQYVSHPISLSAIRRYIVLSDNPDPNEVLNNLKLLELNEHLYADQVTDRRHNDARQFRERHKVSKTLRDHFSRWFQGQKRVLLEEFQSDGSRKRISSTLPLDSRNESSAANEAFPTCSQQADMDYSMEADEPEDENFFYMAGGEA